MRAIVSVRKCEDYDIGRLSQVVERVIGDIGGMAAFVKAGDRVLLKPNLLKSASPDQAAVTHPAVVEAVAALVMDCGGKPFIGDSPPLGSLGRVLTKSGYDGFMNRMGISAVPFVERRSVEFGEGRLFRRIDLAAEAFEFDRVINLPKLKTHCQMVLTLAVKNLFGLVMGSDKAAWHLRAGRDFDTFAEVLVQIYETVRPCFSLLDGILSMEGEGPNSGDARQVGILAASVDAVALDTVIAGLVGFRPDQIRTCVIGHRLGLGTADLQEIERTGDVHDGFPLSDFRQPRSMSVTWNLSHWNPARRFMENHVVTKPTIDAGACMNCGICMNHCPPQAITEVDGLMVIDRRKCISCFCCHELCQSRAVEIVKPFWGRVLSKLTR